MVLDIIIYVSSKIVQVQEVLFMSYSDGMAAIDLEMPSRVPRTEYSAHTHWKLINAVTGTDISPKSSDKEKRAAGNSFIKAWNYDFMWSTLISSNVFGSVV